MVQTSAHEQLLRALEAVSRSIRAIEHDALKALEDKDQGAYREKMREKALVLQNIPRAMAPFLERLEPGQREAVASRLDRFARSAGTALKLGSVFYMSALLYPEDYRDGDPNDLERFIAEFGG
jgi:hypothetical protein